MSNTIKQTVFGKVIKSLVLATVSTALMIGAIQFQSSISESKNAAAAGTNNANLIIGKVDTGTAIELSICLQNTGDNIRLANASTWFNFSNAELTPSPTILQSGIYSSANGYGPFKFQQVLPAPTAGQTSETWTMRTDYLGDGVTAGLSGTAIPTTVPELVGKVKFNKVGTTGTNLITLTKSAYYTVEYPLAQIAFTVINQNTACNTVVASSSSSSATVSSSSATPASSSAVAGSSRSSSSSATPVVANTGGVITIYAAKNCPAGEYAKQGACIECPANSYCPGGLTNGVDTGAITCTPTQTSPAKSTKATDCVENKVEVKNTIVNSDTVTIPKTGGETVDEYTTCDGGKQLIKNADGKYSCNTCEAGYYCPGGKENRKIECNQGYYCPVGTTAQIICKNGYSTMSSGSKASSDCELLSKLATKGVTVRTGSSVNVGLIGIITFVSVAIANLAFVSRREYSLDKEWKKL